MLRCCYCYCINVLVLQDPSEIGFSFRGITKFLGGVIQMFPENLTVHITDMAYPEVLIVIGSLGMSLPSAVDTNHCQVNPVIRAKRAGKSGH